MLVEGKWGITLRTFARMLRLACGMVYACLRRRCEFVGATVACKIPHSCVLKNPVHKYFLDEHRDGVFRHHVRTVARITAKTLREGACCADGVNVVCGCVLLCSFWRALALILPSYLITRVAASGHRSLFLCLQALMRTFSPCLKHACAI